MDTNKKVYVKVKLPVTLWDVEYCAEILGVFDEEHMIEDKRTYLQEAREFIRKEYDKNYKNYLYHVEHSKSNYTINQYRIKAERAKEIFYSEEKTLNYYLSHLYIAYIDVELNLPQPYGIPVI